MRTGATKILNSKGELSRCSLPRIIPVDSREEENLGDRQGPMEDEERVEIYEEDEGRFILTGNNLEKSRSRKHRREGLKDLIRWGETTMDQDADTVLL